MIPTTSEIATQIAVAHDMFPEDTISELAARLAYSPIFIINALDEGEKREWFVREKDEKGKVTDKLITVVPIDYENSGGMTLGKENIRIQNEILRVISSANDDEDDVEHETLKYWCRGIKPMEVDIAIHVLLQLGYITRYTLADPSDKKSNYDFYTLRVNEGEKWGRKQFKSKKKGKKSDDRK